MNRKIHKPQLLLFALLFIVYAVFLYSFLKEPYSIDFTCLYSSALFFIEGINPYDSIAPFYLSHTGSLPANLNPPFFLWVFSPMAYLNYRASFLTWSLLSILLSLTSIRWMIDLAFAEKQRIAKWPLYFLYFSGFGMLMNAFVGQMGALLLFLIIGGYYFFKKNHDAWAGLFWGLAIAIKFFPGLLLLYVLIERRFKIFGIMILTTLVSTLLPFFIYGSKIYEEYLDMFQKVYWYGESWNSSLYGFIFRIDAQPPEEIPPHLHLILILWFLISICFLIGYVQNLRFNRKTPNTPHKSFCFTLVLMLFLSPLSWVYYFPLLAFPLLITWQALSDNPDKGLINAFSWLIALFFLNFPQINNIKMIKMTTLINKMGYGSIYFYGLLLLLIHTAKLKENAAPDKELFLKADTYQSPIFVMVLFVLIMYVLNFLKYCW